MTTEEHIVEVLADLYVCDSNKERSKIIVAALRREREEGRADDRKELDELRKRIGDLAEGMDHSIKTCGIRMAHWIEVFPELLRKFAGRESP